MGAYSLEVVRQDLATTRTVDLAAADKVQLADGEAIIRVDRFGLTANNITYGVAGDMIGYWQFFPASDEWGRIPVWGVGTVVNTGNSSLNEGDQFYGYFPMSSYLVVKPEHVTTRGFVDASAHRADLPPTYNQYSLISEANGFSADTLDHRMVFFPLFATGFILDDWLFDNDFFGAEDIIISSASSKTSFSLAFMLHQRGSKRVIGLTSAGNKAFVEGMGIYDEVVTYDDVEALDGTRKCAFVDMAGNGDITARIHHHYGENCVCSSGVGITHWESRDGQGPAELPGARHEMFFAPTQMQKRNKDWGAEKYQENMQNAWNAFLGRVDDWVSLNVSEGPEGMTQTYQTVLNGAPPDQGYVIAV